MAYGCRYQDYSVGTKTAGIDGFKFDLTCSPHLSIRTSGRILSLLVDLESNRPGKKIIFVSIAVPKSRQ
jgi:hypothetical protein